MSRSVVRVVVGIVVALVLVAAVGGGLVWWKVAELKKNLTRDLGKSLGAQVDVASLDLDVWKGQLLAAGITLANERPSAPWDKGEISQATVSFHFGDLFASTMPLTVDLGTWNVVLRPFGAGTSGTSGTTGTSETAAASDEAGGMDSGSAGSNPSRFRVTQISAHEGEVEIVLSANEIVNVHGVAFQAGDNGAGRWITQLQATAVEAGSLQAGSSSVEIESEPGKITFSTLRMQCGQGLLTGDGEVALSDGYPMHFDLKAEQIPLTMLVAVDWQMKLSGAVDGTLHYEGSDGDGSATGQIAVSQGRLNVLPWLDKVMALVSLPDVSNLDVDKATSDFTWKDHALQLTNLDVRKEGIVRISGEADVDPRGQVDGKLKLGLPSTILAKWPQLQTSIFSEQSDDYCWTDVHVTGRPDHLKEDLTPRLLVFGLGQGGDLLNSASQKAADLLKKFLGQ